MDPTATNAWDNLHGRVILDYPYLARALKEGKNAHFRVPWEF